MFLRLAISHKDKRLEFVNYLITFHKTIQYNEPINSIISIGSIVFRSNYGGIDVIDETSITAIDIIVPYLLFGIGIAPVDFITFLGIFFRDFTFTVCVSLSAYEI